VNFNVNFNVLLSIYILHPLKKIKKNFDSSKLKRSILILMYKFCLKYFLFCEEFSGILSRIYTGLHMQYLLFFSNFNENLIFSADFPQITQISNFMKTVPR